MKIKLSGAGKRFNREWIFRKANLEFNTGGSYAVTGPNGSGKSTLLQCLGGMLQPSEGHISYELNGASIEPEQAYKQVSFCAPYMELIEEMTLSEFLQFHEQFKPLLEGHSVKTIIHTIGLEAAAGKQIRYYSSGMKQRVKLAQAFFSRTGALLLDEPCSNLDAKGIDLYHQLVKDYTSNRLLVVCSNDPVEYSFCKEVVSITEFK